MGRVRKSSIETEVKVCIDGTLLHLCRTNRTLNFYYRGKTKQNKTKKQVLIQTKQIKQTK